MEEVHVILVDEKDQQVGIMEKMEAHEKALLHRAVSVFVINSKGEWLLQQRALHKYHSADLWTNTCCTHPLPDETNLEGANRRLQQEMGMECELKELFSFTYKELLDNDFTEYEIDHVFIGFSNLEPIRDPTEVANTKYFSYQELDSDVKINPDRYTVWFKKIYQQVYQHLQDA